MRRMRYLALVAVLLAVVTALAACSDDKPGAVIGKVQGNDTYASWSPGPIPVAALPTSYRIDESPEIPGWLSDIPTAAAVVGGDGQVAYWFAPEGSTVVFRPSGEGCIDLLK